MTEPPLTLPADAGRPDRRLATGGGARGAPPDPRSVGAPAPGRHAPDDHLPGQHYVVRLTADDGYTAQRSYSVASAPSDPLVELCVERLHNGEVSTFLADVVRPATSSRCAARSAAGSSGTGSRRRWASVGAPVPCRSWPWPGTPRTVGSTEQLKLAVSGRTLPELPYADELSCGRRHRRPDPHAARRPAGRAADRR